MAASFATSFFKRERALKATSLRWYRAYASVHSLRQVRHIIVTAWEEACKRHHGEFYREQSRSLSSTGLRAGGWEWPYSAPPQRITVTVRLLHRPVISGTCLQTRRSTLQPRSSSTKLPPGTPDVMVTWTVRASHPSAPRLPRRPCPMPSPRPP